MSVTTSISQTLPTEFVDILDAVQFSQFDLTHMATIKVVQGKNLQPMNPNGLSDPYCLMGVASPATGEFVHRETCVRSEVCELYGENVLPSFKLFVSHSNYNPKLSFYLFLFCRPRDGHLILYGSKRYWNCTFLPPPRSLNINVISLVFTPSHYTGRRLNHAQFALRCGVRMKKSPIAFCTYIFYFIFVNESCD
jgi:hypothetical protein